MDLTQIIVTLSAAIISSVTTLIVCLINNNAQNNKQKAHIDKIVTVLEYRLDELTKKVDQSSTVNEKVARLESLSLLFDEKINSTIKRLEKLEQS